MLVSLAIAVALILAGVVVLVPMRGLVQTVRSSRWTRGEARLLALDLEEAVGLYEYDVAGQAFRGTTVNTVGYLPAAAHRRLAAYRPGQIVPVWFDPVQPSRATLDRSSTLVAWIATGLGAVAFMVGAVWLVVLLRQVNF